MGENRVSLTLDDLLILLLILPGLAIVVSGIVMIRNRIPLIWRGVRVRGRIAHIEKNTGGPGVRTLSVTFAGPDGLERTLKLDYTPRTWPKQGSEVDVFVDPQQPTRIFTISWPTLVVFPIVTVFGGLLVTAIMLGIYFGREPPGGWPKPEKMPFSRN
jgi:hypothetical protein